MRASLATNYINGEEEMVVEVDCVKVFWYIFNVDEKVWMYK